MIFMAIQTHGPKECPINEENPVSLYDTKNTKVKILHIFANPPAHVLYYVLESSNFSDLQEFFGPGMDRSIVDIKPVTETHPHKDISSN